MVKKTFTSSERRIVFKTCWWSSRRSFQRHFLLLSFSRKQAAAFWQPPMVDPHEISARGPIGQVMRSTRVVRWQRRSTRWTKGAGDTADRWIFCRSFLVWSRESRKEGDIPKNEKEEQGLQLLMFTLERESLHLFSFPFRQFLTQFQHVNPPFTP